MKKSLCLFLLCLISFSYSINLNSFEKFLKNINSIESQSEIEKKLNEFNHKELAGNNQDEVNFIQKSSKSKKSEKAHLKSLLSKVGSEFVAFNTKKLNTQLPPILSGWLSIKTDYFQYNNSIPALNSLNGALKFNVDEKNRLVNNKFTQSAETDKLKITKFHFYARINEGYIYFTPTAQSFITMLNIPLNKILKVENNIDKQNCFDIEAVKMKNNENTKFTFCPTNNDETYKWTCLLKLLPIHEDYAKCLKKMDLFKVKPQPKIVKRKINQPFLVIPTPARMCNQGWNYAENGNNWECLCKEGKEQSPIDLPLMKDSLSSPIQPLFDYDTVNLDDSSKLKIKYNKNALRIDADTNEVLSARGFGRIVTKDGTVYYANQINFRTPSEHTIAGRHFPLEIQILHEAKSKGDFGKKVILSFLFEGKPGIYNKFIDNIEFFNLPNPHDKIRTLHNKIFIPHILMNSDEQDLNIIKPFSFYTYQGSLTEPPCAENVIHYVASNPIPASITAIDMIKEALRMPDFEDAAGNVIVSPESPMMSNRAVQPLNGRNIFVYDSALFNPPLFLNKQQEVNPYEGGHFERKEVELTNYVYIEGNGLSGIPGAIMVPEEEAEK